MKEQLTERVVKGLRPQAKNVIIHDREVIGFGVRITPGGTKAFVLTYRFEARERRMTIGAWPDWSVSAAREEAKRLKREVDQGRDPLADREGAREAPTIRHLIDRYLAEHTVKLSKHGQTDQAAMLRKRVAPVWGARKVADIQPEDVDRLLRTIALGVRSKTKRRPTPVRANRVGEVLRKMFNLAIRWRMRPDNPAAGFARNPETPRERYLSLDEIARLSVALDEHANRRAADAVRLIMLTGARRGEVLNARWDQFDLDAAIWIKPAATTKQRRLHRSPISSPTVALLRTIRPRVPESCPWVFPGEAKGKPIHDLKRFWDDVRTKAGLPAVRIHDLRHTFASLLVSGGMTLPMIGKLLGHTQVQTTQRYAHLFDDPLRAGLEQVGDMLRAKPKLVQAEAVA